MLPPLANSTSFRPDSITAGQDFSIQPPSEQGVINISKRDSSRSGKTVTGRNPTRTKRTTWGCSESEESSLKLPSSAAFWQKPTFQAVRQTRASAAHFALRRLVSAARISAFAALPAFDRHFTRFSDPPKRPQDGLPNPSPAGLGGVFAASESRLTPAAEAEDACRPSSRASSPTRPPSPGSPRRRTGTTPTQSGKVYAFSSLRTR